mgnify:CR=1 FL=1
MVAVQTLFLVDDHPVFRLGLAALISALPGARVIGEAMDGESALRQLVGSACPPDILVVDLSLPGMGSLEFLRQVRATWPDVKILVLSNHDESHFAQRAIRMGAVGCIMKRQGPGEFTAVIRGALAAGRVQGPVLAASHGALAVGLDRGNEPGYSLSDRELDVFRLTGKGLATREISERLRISVKTVETHKAHIKSKLGLRHAADLARAAVSWVEHVNEVGAA